MTKLDEFTIKLINVELNDELNDYVYDVIVDSYHDGVEPDGGIEIVQIGGHEILIQPVFEVDNDPFSFRNIPIQLIVNVTFYNDDDDFESVRVKIDFQNRRFKTKYYFSINSPSWRLLKISDSGMITNK